jgi:predicted nucleic acid-binding protein
MSPKSPLVVVDADAIVAQAHPRDANFLKATRISRLLVSLNAQVIYPATAVTEAITVLQTKLSSPATAYGTAQLMAGPAAHIIEINKQTLKNALVFFNPKASKKNTLFDCIVAAVAKEYKADAIFSFDKFYQKKGFRLASDL